MPRRLPPMLLLLGGLLGGFSLVSAIVWLWTAWAWHQDAKRHPVRLSPDTPVTFVVTDDAPVPLSPTAARAIVRILNTPPEVDRNRARSAAVGRFECAGRWFLLREHALVTTDHDPRMLWKHPMIDDAYLAFRESGYEFSPELAKAVVERIERFLSANPATSPSHAAQTTTPTIPPRSPAPR